MFVTLKNEFMTNRKATFNVLFFAKKDKKKSNGKYPIQCRITVNGKATSFYTKVDILPVYWDSSAGKAIGRNAECMGANTLLNQILSSIYQSYHNIQNKDNHITAEKVKNSFLGINEAKETLIFLFSKHNEDIKALIGKTKSYETWAKYDRTLRHLEAFLRDKYNLSDISLKEINHRFIMDFEVYLLSVKGCGYNTTAKFMQFFKRIIIIARNNGFIVGDPFANYKIRLKKVDRGYLTEEEIEIILKKTFVSNRLEQVRDIFIFSCFTGLAYIDVKNLRKENIQTFFDGNLWIITHRQKTDTSVNVPLMKIPKMILDKYKNKLPDDKILPVLSNQKMNAYLKEIADVCGISKNLTFHIARHVNSSF